MYLGIVKFVEQEKVFGLKRETEREGGEFINVCERECVYVCT